MLEQLADPVELGEGAGRGHRRAAAPERRVGRHGRPPAADRRRGRRRRRRAAARGREVPRRQHLEVTEGVEDALETLRPGLSGLQTDTSVFRPATFIEDATDNLTLAIVIGGVLLAARPRRVPVPVAHDARRAGRRSRCRWWRRRSCWTRSARRSTRSRSPGSRSPSPSSSTRRSSAPRTSRAAARASRRRRRRRRPSTIVLEATAEVRRPLVYATLIALLAIVPVVVMEGRPGAFFAPLVLGLRARGAGGAGRGADRHAGAERAALLARAAPPCASPPLLR